jgi:hypothetical protein
MRYQPLNVTKGENVSLGTQVDATVTASLNFDTGIVETGIDR